MKRIILLRTSVLCIVLLLASAHTFAQVQFTFKKRVVASTDDAEERQTGGQIDITSSDIELVNDGSTVGNQTIGLRFTGINIPKDAIINNAYIQFAVDEFHSGATTVNIYGEAADNSAGFSTTAFNITNRTKTIAVTAWSSIPAWSVQDQAGADQRTPNIKNVIAEVITRGGWNSGNAITILINGTGRRNAHAYDGNAGLAPELVIEYTPIRYIPTTFPVAKAGLWMYHDSGVVPTGNWKDRDYVDTSWKFGQATLGYGLNDEATTLSFGGNASSKHITYYLRNIFNVTDSAAVDSLIFKLMADDGAVVYLNGAEVFRHNMPTGAITNSTTATTDVAGMNELTFFEYRIGQKLRTGKNVIAVELHQNSATSTDVRFDMEVLGKKPPMTTVNFPLLRGSEWYYNDKGHDLYGSNWTSDTYNDIMWEYGKAPLGYGDAMTTTVGYGPNAAFKYITTYFRKKINIPSLTAIDADSMLVFIRRDDGAVVWINGVEAFRTNMDTGTLNYLSKSLTITDGANETNYYSYVVKKSAFKNGINQIAVALHQRDSSSSDIGFDLEILPYPKVGGGCAPTDAHIACFPSLVPTAQQTKMQLPATHQFQLIFKQGQAYTHAPGNVPGNHDFTAYVGKNGSSTNGVIAVNHENTPGAVSSVFTRYIDSVQLWQVDSTKQVDFYNSDIVTTGRNCSGGITPWGTVITSEETVSSADANADSYGDMGWHVEFDPWTTKVKEYGNGKQEKLWAMGRMNHENIVVLNDSVTAFYGEDGGTQCVYKFVADKAGDLSKGKMYVLKMDNALASGEPTGNTGKWILVPNATASDRNNANSLASGLGGTNFNGVEDCEVGTLDGKIYFTSKGFSRTYRFKDQDSIVVAFETYVGGKSYLISTPGGVYNEPWGSGNDNLTFDDKGNLWVLQDGSRNHFWLVRPDHTQANPHVELFMVSPAGSEPTGMTFSPDYKFMFVSLQHPSSSNATQMDATGNMVGITASSTIVVARKEFLGATKPVAAFKADKLKIHAGGSVSFEDTSLFKPTSRTWYFEGGNQTGSNGKNPVVTYKDSGVYKVKLVVHNQAGADSVEKIAYIDVMPLPPVAKISVNKAVVTEGEPLLFKDNSTGTVNNRNWTFAGATQTSSIQTNVNNSYATMGTYVAYLTVSNRGGATSDSVVISVNPKKPVAQFIANKTTVAINEVVTLTDISGGFVATRMWDAQGGTLSSNASATTTVTYGAAGNYTVKLVVSNITGSDSIVKLQYITVKAASPAPVVNFTANKQTIMEGNFVAFQDLSTGGITSRTWQFPGGFPTTSNDQNPVVFYDVPGSYNVTLTATNDGGSNSTTKTAYITVTKNTTGIDVIENTASVEIYPNPVTDKLYLNFNMQKTAEVSVRIMDVSGRLIGNLHSGVMNIGDNKVELSLNTLSLVKGIYMLEVTVDNQTFTKKLIKN